MNRNNENFKTKKQIGTWGEDFAAEEAAKRGYSILGRNIRTPYGEIDVIATNEEEIVFIEVKTRTNLAYGHPETALTAQKMDHLRNAVLYFLQSNPQENRQPRIDLVCLEKERGSEIVTMEWFENVLSA